MRLGKGHDDWIETGAAGEDTPKADLYKSTVKFELPSFYGGLEEWMTFNARFRAAVHDTNTSWGVKLSQLQDCMKTPSSRLC